jgi:protein-tyrosine phosphatase
VVRSGTLDRLTPAGWSALRAHGIRTIVDLRNPHELGAEGRPDGLAYVHVALDDVDDREFWERCRVEELDGSPLYYRPFLERKPERCAAAVAAVARAGPGGVVVHCGSGRDRAGLVATLLLAVAGVPAGEIAADYELSASAPGLEDETREIQAALARRGTSARVAMLDLLATLDVPAYLRDAGVSRAELVAIEERL